MFKKGKEHSNTCSIMHFSPMASYTKSSSEGVCGMGNGYDPSDTPSLKDKIKNETFLSKC